MRSAMATLMSPNLGFAALRKPRLHVAIVCTLRIGDREQKARVSVEEPEPQHIGAEERPDPVRDAVRERDAPAGGDQHLGAGGRVAVDARDRLLEPRDRAMCELLGETPDRAVADHPLMHE